MKGALLAASELDPQAFQAQLAQERGTGAVRETHEDGRIPLEHPSVLMASATSLRALDES